MVFLVIILFFTFMYMWYLTASQFYVKNYEPVLKKEGLCSKVISPIWKKVDKCCLSYDEKYIYGGSENFRKTVDYQIKTCALKQGIEEKSTIALFYAVRLLGTPYIDTPWRWGYGYDFGGGYRDNL